jgi:hypothetical protein
MCHFGRVNINNFDFPSLCFVCPLVNPPIGESRFSYFSGAILSKCQQNEEIWLVNSKILSHRTIGHDISSTVDLYKVYESYKI